VVTTTELQLDWDKCAEQAMGIISLLLHSTLQGMIKGCATPQDAYTLLETHYDLSKTAVCNHLYTKLFTLKLEPTMELAMHFSCIDNLVGQLQSDTLKFPEDLINWVTLASLPQHFSIIKTILNSSHAPLTKDNVCTSLLQHEALHHPVKAHEKDTLLHTQVQNGAKNSQKSKKQGAPQLTSQGCLDGQQQPRSPLYNPDVMCDYCSRTGHLIHDCCTCCKEQNLNKVNVTKSCPSNTITEHLLTSIVINALTSSTMVHPMDWIFDTGGSRTITHQ
jgi:hypothetical protein